MLKSTGIELSPAGEQQLNYPVEFMRFRLVYDGPLLTKSNSSRRGLQYRIRQQLHHQLRELFRTHPALEEYYTTAGPRIGNRWLKTIRVGNFDFLPLVREDRWMTCHLDILFLARMEPTGLVIRGGDIDNRIKVFLDALRRPLNPDELPPAAQPAEGENPFFCLLDDDKLVTGFSVRSDRLLSVPRDGESESDVRLVIDASVKVSKLRPDTIDFAGD